jgi:ribosomal protein S21
MAKVRVRVEARRFGEDIRSFLGRFAKEVGKSGILKSIRDKSVFEREGDKRRKKKRAAEEVRKKAEEDLGKRYK